jgi:hypothetical protein
MRSGASPSPPGSSVAKRTFVATTTWSRRAASQAARGEEAVEHPVRLADRRAAAHQHRPEAEAADGQRPEGARLHRWHATPRDGSPAHS